MFGRFAAFVIRIKWLVVVVWVAAAAVLFLTAPKLSDIISTDSGSFLPSDSKTAEANKLIKSLFPDSVSHTSLVLVISSDSPFTAADDEYVLAIDKYFTKNKESLSIGDVLSPGTNAAMKTQLASKDGKVSLVYLNVDGRKSPSSCCC